MIYTGIILLVVVGAFVLNTLYKRTNHYNNQFLDVKKIQDSVKNGEKYDIVNLGSNHPKFAFDYSVASDVKGANWAVGPQTFEYDFAILRHNTHCLAQGAIVIIPVCLLSFFKYRDYSRALHAKYYGFLSKEGIVEYNRKEKLMSHDFPLFFHPKRLRYLIKDVKPTRQQELTTNPMKSDAELNNDAEFWIDCWNKEFNIQLPNPVLSDKNKSDIQQNIHILCQMLQYCKSNGFRPIIAILPVTKYLSAKFTIDFIQKHILNYISEANEVNAPVLNYLSDERFSEASLYINSFFMNKKGRTFFTNIFLKGII